MTHRTAPAKEAAVDERDLKWAIERAYLLEEEYRGKHTATGNNDAKAIRLMLAAIGSVEQSRRSSPVREGEGVATPKTTSHPSRLYRKKPVVIEAVQWNGGRFCSLDEPWRSLIAPRYGGAVYQAGDSLCVETLEGKMIASLGDWIICGVKGELYPCKPDIFAATYEAVTEPTNEMGAERSGASPSSADLSRGSDAPSVNNTLEIAKGIAAFDERRDGDFDDAWVEDAIAVAHAYVRSQMAQSNDHARSAEALFAAIAHGDEAHRAWLKEAITAYFSGLPVPAPVNGKSREEAIAEAEDARENEVWDQVVASLQRAWHEPRGWSQSPTELITDLINERDEALASPSEPSGRGESGGIQGPASEASMNKEADK